jgi:pimeloyl-ACP methyl ester carboxylesterase
VLEFPAISGQNAAIANVLYWGRRPWLSEQAIQEVSANGMTFRSRAAGLDNASGEAVILLHGFPETSIMWASLIAELSDEGYRCIAPDQRGYSPGARPDGIEAYTYDKLTSDVVALADAQGFQRFHLIGHDWGSVIGWAVMHLYPDRIQSWTAMSVPHVDAFRSAIADDPDQQQRSQYLGLFMLPGEAEKILTANDFTGLRAVYSSIPEDQAEEYLLVFSQPGALTAALNWYRANSRLLDQSDPAVTFGPVSHPTLLLWGNQDIAVGRASVERTAPYMRGPYRLVELNAGHWLAQEEPERVHHEIHEHLGANRMPGSL